MAYRGKLTISLFVICLFSLLAHPGLIFAHSALLEAFPSINSHMDYAPTEIRLKFNERLEKELYYIHVFDEQGKLVTNAETQISQDQSEIHLNLPPLGEGNYTVSYQVISADGHPISQAFLISVGNVAEKYDTDRDSYIADHGDAFLWFIRMLYYFIFLAYCGMILWKYLYPLNKKEGMDLYNLWFKYTRRSYLIILLLLGIIQFYNVWEKFGIKAVPAAFLFTFSGQAWCSSVVLITLSTFLLGKSKWFDYLLVFLLLGAEGINGHAVAFQPVWLSVSLDAIHLAAAAIWVGGLFFFLIVWKEIRDWTDYVLLFSKLAFWSMVTLVLTGGIISLLFLPTPSFLLNTQWGILVLVKSLLVMGVIAVAAMARKRRSLKEEEKFQFWLKWDCAFLSLIVIVAAGLTNSSPIPANDPFVWSERQNSLNLNMEITPNNPGVNNTFNISVEMLQGKEVKNIELRLKHLGEQNIAPISIPLKKLPNNVPEINRYSYSSVGPFLSLPGTWTVEVSVSDQDNAWTQFKKDMTIYAVKQNK
jgi:copper transport protein